MGVRMSKGTEAISMNATAPVKLRGPNLVPSKVPAVTVFGTLKHKNTVQHFYRRALKWQYFYTGINQNYDVYVFAWTQSNTRKLFEENRHMKDPAAVNQMLKDMEEAMDTIPPYDPHVYHWAGPTGNKFLHDWISDTEYGRWFEGCMLYGDGWIEYSMDEHFTKLKIEEIKHKYETQLTHFRMQQDDFLYYYGMKKEFEKECRWEIAHYKKTVHRSYTQRFFEWPYIYPNEIEAAGAWGDPMRSASSPDLDDMAQWQRDEEKIWDKDLICTMKFFSMPIPSYIPWCPGRIHDFAV